MSDQSIIQIDQILLTFPTLDQGKIDTMRTDDPSGELLPELIKIFNVELQDKLALIKNEFAARNFDELSKLAHRIRSTSLTLGAIRLAEIFKRLEYLNPEQFIQSTEIQFLIQSAEKEYICASKKLKSYLPQGMEGTPNDK